MICGVASTVSQLFSKISLSSWPFSQLEYPNETKVFSGCLAVPNVSNTSFDVVIMVLSLILILELKPETGVCKIKPCSSATGPPDITGFCKLIALSLSAENISNCSKTLSIEISSIGLLITKPIAPFSLCSQT